jgi:hypothetical protein
VIEGEDEQDAPAVAGTLAVLAGRVRGGWPHVRFDGRWSSSTAGVLEANQTELVELGS